MTNADSPDPDAALGRLLREALRDPSAPAPVVARAIALRSPLREAVRQATATLRRVLALPVFDAAGGLAPAAGVRVAGAGARHLLYRAESCEVDLRIGPQGAAWAIAGQVLGAGGAREVVLTGAEGSRSANLGPTCEFNFAQLAAGRYELTVKTPELEIVIPAVEVGPVP